MYLSMRMGLVTGTVHPEQPVRQVRLKNLIRHPAMQMHLKQQQNLGTPSLHPT
jgi:hypothetical protein